MSALDKMVADILAKAIPPEVMQMLSPENIKQYGDVATGFITEVRGKLDAILASQERERATLQELSERIDKCLEQKPLPKKSQNTVTEAKA
jgi:ABC-type transporter Mla subunit MlaD